MSPRINGILSRLQDLFETFSKIPIAKQWYYEKTDENPDIYLNLVLYTEACKFRTKPKYKSVLIVNNLSESETDPHELANKVVPLIVEKEEKKEKRKTPDIYVVIYKCSFTGEKWADKYYEDLFDLCLYFKYIAYNDIVQPRQKDIEEAIVPFIESIRINGEIFSAKWYIDIHGSEDYIDLDLALYDRYFDSYFEKIKKPGDKSIALDGVVDAHENFKITHSHKGFAAKFGPGVAAGVASFVADAVENKYEKQIRVNIYNCKKEDSVLLFSFLIPKTTEESTVPSTNRSSTVPSTNRLWSTFKSSKGGKSGDSSWIAHVRRVQEQANKSKARKNKPMTWNEAMKAASKTYKKR